MYTYLYKANIKKTETKNLDLMMQVLKEKSVKNN